MSMSGDAILAIDDQPEVRRLLADIFRQRGREMFGFSDGDEAIQFLRDRSAEIGLVVLDLDLGIGKKQGLTLLPEIRAAFPELNIIILTGNGTIDTAVSAVKAGAADFLVKDMYLEDKLDLSVEKIERMLTHVRERRRLEGENRELRAANRRLREAEERRQHLVGDSDPMREVKAKIEKVARVPRPVLVLGERGTGATFSIFAMMPRIASESPTICQRRPAIRLSRSLVARSSRFSPSRRLRSWMWVIIRSIFSTERSSLSSRYGSLVMKSTAPAFTAITASSMVP